MELLVDCSGWAAQASGCSGWEAHPAHVDGCGAGAGVDCGRPQPQFDVDEAFVAIAFDDARTTRAWWVALSPCTCQ